MPGGVESQQMDWFLLDAEWQPNEYTLALMEATPRGSFIHLWDLRNNSNRNFSTSHSFSVVRLAWSPDGKQIATASADAEVHIAY